MDDLFYQMALDALMDAGLSEEEAENEIMEFWNITIKENE